MKAGELTTKTTTAGPGRPLLIYLIGFALIYIGFVTYSYLEWRRLIALAALAAPLAVIVIAHPRLALYQYVFCLFIHIAIIPSVPVYIADLSALMVVIAAAVDILVNERVPERAPGLVVNFALLIVAMLLSAVFGYGLLTSLRPIARVLFLVIVFLSMYRLSRHVTLRRILAVYFWLAVAHSVIVLAPFFFSGGTVRSFGVAWAVFDELSMLAAPVGLSFYLWSEKPRSWLYLAGTGLVFLALLATQSRAPILFGLLSILLVLWQARRRTTRFGGAEPIEDSGEANSGTASSVRKRARTIVSIGIGLGLLAVVVSPGVLTAVFQRFERLWTLSPGGTFAIRLVLWKWALRAFIDHPLLGIGPGLFRSLGSIYPSLHMTPLHYYVQFLSAHNLTLHYLAETGLVGASVLVALFINQFRMARRCWVRMQGQFDAPVGLALYALGFLFLVTTLIEAGWMWGQTGFMMAFFLALIARGYRPQGA